MTSRVARHLAIFLAVCGLLAAAVQAQRAEPLPDDLEGVGIEERLDTDVDATLSFRDEEGNAVVLGDYLSGDLPVVLTLNYANCPKLCGLQLNGLVDTLKALSYRPGREFRLITVSIDPTETPAQAKEKKQTFIERLGDETAADGWHFLVGAEKNIKRLADQVGFGYRIVEETGEFAHTAVSIILTPDGRVSRYLYGVRIPERSMRFALLEAGEGKIGTTVDQAAILFCYVYDPESGSYAVSARKLMRAGGIVILSGVVIMMLALWRRDRRSKGRVQSRTN